MQTKKLATVSVANPQIGETMKINFFGVYTGLNNIRLVFYYTHILYRLPQKSPYNLKNLLQNSNNNNNPTAKIITRIHTVT